MNNPFAETILSGSMLLAIPVAMLAGLVSFLSPCVLPLVPGYLGYVSGLTGVDLENQRRGRMFAGIGLFVLGFSVVFVLIGAVFGQLGAWLMGPDAAWVTQVLGAVVILGLVVVLLLRTYENLGLLVAGGAIAFLATGAALIDRSDGGHEADQQAIPG